MDHSDQNKRIAKNSIFLSIRMVIVLGINLYTTRAVLNMLGVVDYGIYNVVCGFVSMFTFLNMSMSNGIQRFYNYELGKNGEEGANRVYITSLYIQLALAIVIILLTETFGLWYLYNKMVLPETRLLAASWVYQFSILSFVFIIFQSPYMAAVMAHERMDFFAFVSVIDAILKLGVVILTPLFLSDRLVVYGLLWMFVSVAVFFIYLLYCKKCFPEIKFRKEFQRSQFKSMLSFSGWNIFGAFSGVMKDQGISLIMNAFYGPIVNAANAVAIQVNAGLQSFVQNITVPVRPQVIQSYAQGNIERSMNLTFSISKLSCCFLYLVALPVFAETDYILSFWLGNNIPEHTNIFIKVVILTSFITNLNAAVSGVVHASGKMMLYQIAGGLAGLSTVPIAYIVLQLGGGPASALIVVLVLTAIAQLNALLILKTIVCYSMRNYFVKVICPFLIVVITTAFIPYVISCFMQTGFLRLIVVSVISAVVVSLSIYFIGLDSSERAIVNQMLSKIKSFHR